MAAPTANGPKPGVEPSESRELWYFMAGKVRLPNASKYGNALNVRSRNSDVSCGFFFTPLDNRHFRPKAVVRLGCRAVSVVPFVSDVAPTVFSVMIRLEVLALPRAPAATVVAIPTTPLAVPAPGAVRRRVVIRVTSANHDTRTRLHYTGGQQ